MQSECRKLRTRKTPNTDTLNAVSVTTKRSNKFISEKCMTNFRNGKKKEYQKTVLADFPKLT